MKSNISTRGDKYGLYVEYDTIRYALIIKNLKFPLTRIPRSLQKYICITVWHENL